MVEVRVINKSSITVACRPENLTPTFTHIKLSLFDAPWIILSTIQRLFLFQRGGDGEDLLPSFPAVAESLRRALSVTLSYYFPLAGRLAYVPSTGDVVLDCSAAAVAFIEAESDGDIRRLVENEERDNLAFSKLVPPLDVKELPASVLSVQVTKFAGGLSVGLAVHHAVADGRAVWRFVEAWSAACRGESPVGPGLGLPSFDRGVMLLPKAEAAARAILKTTAPNLPSVYTTGRFDSLVDHRLRLKRRTFVLEADRVNSLKQRILRHRAKLPTAAAAAAAAPPPRLSVFVSVAAVVRTSFVRTKCLNVEDDAYLLFFVDVRTRLDPPIDVSYFGNCVKGCIVKALASDLLGDDGLFHASLLIHDAVQESVVSAEAYSTEWLDRMVQLPLDRLATILASPRFKVYETDFGWGKPSRVELVSLTPDGKVTLVAGKEDGDVQVSVSLHPANMDAFRSHFFREAK